MTRLNVLAIALIGLSVIAPAVAAHVSPQLDSQHLNIRCVHTVNLQNLYNQPCPVDSHTLVHCPHFIWYGTYTHTVFAALNIKNVHNQTRACRLPMLTSSTSHSTSSTWRLSSTPVPLLAWDYLLQSEVVAPPPLVACRQTSLELLRCDKLRNIVPLRKDTTCTARNFI